MIEAMMERQRTCGHVTSSGEFNCPSWLSLGAMKLITRILDPNLMTRITPQEVFEDEWFKKDYKPPVFEEKDYSNMDDIDAVFKNSEMRHENVKAGRKGNLNVATEAASRPDDAVVDIDAADADNELAAAEYVDGIFRKHKDLYMWMVRSLGGPSVKFLVNAVHTMEELKLTGNHLRGLAIFGIPEGHRKSKPYHDYVFVFSIVDDHIWFRNYQISVPHNELDKIARGDLDKMTLIEDGVVGIMTKAEQLAANTRTDAATSATWIPLDDLKVVFCSITEDLVQMITDTYRRIDKRARNTQQPPSSEDVAKKAKPQSKPEVITISPDENEKSCKPRTFQQKNSWNQDFYRNANSWKQGCKRTERRKQVLAMEKSILGQVEWYITVPTPYVFLARYVKASVPCDIEMEKLVFYLAELGLMQYPIVVLNRPSILATSVVYAARQILKKTAFWTETLKHHIGYLQTKIR
ncbi:Cyclin C-terminal domain [Arabidopsis thaliana x Arabidopsis arenosa]|uniref:Cyclin C-terminal domain n=1 Tax=Arabidopsis thaliana x Arabidopsis arenosa TaxID=1240361 RepID=A0A8T2A827_9BRAS|nr:Cyclin C-terminal domain [Arabidopsis thaliana x Arabidopsis arenosa]